MRNFVFVFVLYSFVFHWYPYFYDWVSPDQPTAPIYILISRDVIFLLLLFTYITKKVATGFEIGIPGKGAYQVVAFCYVGLLIAMLLGAFHTNVLEFAQHNARNLMMYVLIIPIYFHVCRTARSDPTSVLSKMFVCMGVLLSVFGIITILYLDRSYLWGGVRVYSLMGNPNSFGTFLLIPSLIVWYMFLQTSQFIERTYLGLALLLFAVALVLTLSFQSYLSFVLSLVTMALLVRGSRAVVTILGLSLTAITILFLVNEHLSVITDAFLFKMESPLSTSYTGRLEQFDYVLNHFMNIENWLVGVPTLSEYERFDSQYYNIFINNGLIALVLYIIPPCLTIYLAFRKRTQLKNHVDIWHQAIYHAGLVFISIVMLFTANMTAFMQRFPINMYFYLILSILLYGITIKGKNPRSEIDSRFAGS